MKKLYIYLPLFFIFIVGCQKEELLLPDEMQENLQIGSEKLPYISLPEYIKNVFPEELSFSKKAGENRNSFGNMRTDIPAIKIKNKNGQVSYTIALKKLSGDSQNLYFDNLVITELEKDRKKYTILHYLPEPEWYNSSTRDVKDFSGTIEFYTLTGEFLGKLSLLHGEGIEDSEVNKGYSTTCTYTHEKTLCTGETTMDGDVHGDSYSCDFYFNESCTTTYTNDSPSYTNEEETIDQGDSGGGGGIATTPVPDEEVKLVNELDNPCAKNIFYQLENGLYKDDLLKPEIQMPEDILSLNFTETILKLFNNSSNLNYTIKNGILRNPEANASTIGATTILSNDYLLNATQLSITRTMIHEMIHAYLNVTYQNALTLNTMSFRQKMDLYAEDNGYDPNSTDPDERNRFHHEFMGQFVTAMAYSLYEWDKDYGTGGNLGWNYYYAMAGAGLSYKDSEGNGQFTNSFYELFSTPEKVQEVIDITTNEMQGNDDAKGNKC